MYRKLQACLGLNKLLPALLVAVLLAPPALADDLNNGSWSTTDASNNAAPPNGWPAGMFPNQVAPAARADKGGVKRWWERSHPGISSTGSAGSYVLTPTNTSFPTAYTQGDIFCWKANFASVGNDTLNVNSLGAKPLYVQGSSIARIAANIILSGAQVCAAYDGALNSAAGGFQVMTQTYPAGLGTAAGKAASNNALGTVASVNGATTFGTVPVFNDANGSIYDVGIAVSDVMRKSENLAFLSNKATARSNLDLGTAATLNVGIGGGGVPVIVSGGLVDGNVAVWSGTSGNISNTGMSYTDILLKSGNLAGISNTTAARSNLDLGSWSVRNQYISNSGPSGSANEGDVWLQW